MIDLTLNVDYKKSLVESRRMQLDADQKVDVCVAMINAGCPSADQIWSKKQ